MLKKHFTRKDLINKVHQNLGFSKNISSIIIDDFFEYVMSELIKSNKIKISSFGTFKIMTKEERMTLISDFKQNLVAGGGAIIGVQGANFSEGIDLPGDLLKAVAIVGVPFAPPDLRQKAVIDYYEQKFGKGWDYGYIFPAMNKALQAAGRCIRSETDRGIIVFLDKRFSWSKYARVIPPDWIIDITDNFREKAEKFFSK